MIRFLQTPTKTKKIVLGAVLIIICVMMVISLTPTGSGGFAANDDFDLATVGGEPVTLDEAQKLASNMARQQRFPDEYVRFLLPQAATSLIQNKALLYEAKKLGLAVSDEELALGLRNQFGEQLFPNGQFVGEEQYSDFITQNTRRTVPEFEEGFRAYLTIQKLQSVVGGSAVVSDSEVQDFVRRQQTKVKFDYAVISFDDVEKGINPSDAELRSYFQQHQAQYKDSIPERRNVRLVLLDAARVPGAEPSQADIQSYYNQHQEAYRTPELVKLRHILVRTTPAADGKPDAKTDATARAKAEDLLKQAKSGANFGELAKKSSEDPGSKDDGGYMEISKGQTVPEFEQAAFSAKAGEIVGPVRTNYGFHVIKVEAHQPAAVRPLSEVSDQIASIVAQQKGASAAQRLSETVRSDARAQGLEKAAAAKGLTATTTGFISRRDILPGVGPQPELMNAIFAAQRGSAPSVVPISQGHAIFEVVEIQPPATPAYEQAKADVERAFRSDRAQILLVQRAQQLADRARAENNLKKAAKEAGAVVKTSELVGATSQVPDIGSMSGPASVAFNMKPGEIAGPVQGGRNGVVISLIERQEPTADEIRAGSSSARAQLLDRKRNEQMAVYADSIMKQMEKNGDIKRNTKALEKLSSRSPLGS